MTVPSNEIISIQNLSHRYTNGSSLALNSINLQITRGSIFGLLGPNGAGKSTLLSILTGINRPQSGQVIIAGHDLATDSQTIRTIGALVPQEYAFYPSLTGRENLKFFAGLYRLNTAQWAQRLEHCVTVCRLQEILDGRAEHYSGGLKRRLNLAIGLLAAPQILYLDEPTVGIDAVSRGYIIEAIAQLKGSGTSIIYTSHYMEEVEALCDDLAVIDHGKVIAHDRVAHLLSKQARQILNLTFAHPMPDSTHAELATWQAEFSDARHVTMHADINQLPAMLQIFDRHGVTVEQLQYGVSRLHDVYLRLLEERT